MYVLLRLPIYVELISGISYLINEQKSSLRKYAYIKSYLADITMYVPVDENEPRTKGTLKECMSTTYMPLCIVICAKLMSI
jgi:hypothetical protein